MQPMLIIRSAVPGMVFVNGRFAGEAGEDSAVSMPVSARGMLYIELRPLQGGYLPLARRFAMANGRPVGTSIEGQPGLSALSWPGGVLEIELAPERARATPPKVLSGAQGDLTLRLIDGDTTQLELTRNGQAAVHSLPDGAQPPEARALPDGTLALTGDADAGRYLLLLGPDLSDALLSVTGREVELTDSQSVRALVDMGDTVGHARLMHWSRAGGRFVPGETESLWAQGAPVWPDDPEATALAALEASLLGLRDESHAYFTPGFRAQDNRALAEARAADGCTRLRYPLPDGRQAVGLVSLSGDNCAHVTPVAYHALPMGGTQGAWRLDSMELA